MPINIFATNGYMAEHYELVYSGGNNNVISQINVYINVNGNGLFDAWIYSNLTTNFRVDAQVVIEYTDGSYDYFSKQGSPAYNSRHSDCLETFVYDTTKTIYIVYAETHVYIGGSYYDTMTYNFYLSDFYPYN